MSTWFLLVACWMLLAFNVALGVANLERGSDWAYLNFATAAINVVGIVVAVKTLYLKKEIRRLREKRGAIK